MREKSAVVIGVGVAALSFFMLGMLASALEMPFSVPGTGEMVTHGTGRELYETEDSGGLVGLGLCALFLGPMLGWIAYHWTLSGRLDGGLETASLASWAGCFSGIALYALGSIVLHLIEPSERMARLADLGLTGIAGYIGFQVWASISSKRASSRPR